MRAFLSGLIVATLVAATGVRAGTSTDVVFTDPSALASNSEIARRLLTPLEGAQLPDLLAKAGKGLRDQPIDLSGERFVLYVPDTKPSQGYALFVFVPPWDDERVPPEWKAVFEREGVIYVAAARSGNDQSVLGRREPLALLAVQNVLKRYTIDPKRIYIGGFSGGARVALRIALGYPDVFSGVILNSGSDPIGTRQLPIPPKDLFTQFQSSTRLVFITGENDPYIRQGDFATRKSLDDWCVFHVTVHPMRSEGHTYADASILESAFDELAAPTDGDAGKLAQCRAGLGAQLDQKLQEIEAMIAARRFDDARSQLQDLDQRYGGLAAPRSLELAKALPAR